MKNMQEIAPLAAVLYRAGLTPVRRLHGEILKDRSGREYLILNCDGRWFTPSPELNGTVQSEAAEMAKDRLSFPLGVAIGDGTMRPLWVWAHKKRVRRALRAFGFLPPEDPHEEAYGDIAKTS